MTSISALIHAVQKTVRIDNVQVLLSEPFTNRTARELMEASRRIATQFANLAAAKTKIEASTDGKLIDAALEMDAELDRLKDGLRGIRREILRLPEIASAPSPALHDAITSLRISVDDAYTAANQLQWEIAEHDASHAPRGKPVIATNQDELDEALNAIREEK